MGLIDTLERLLIPSKRSEKRTVGLKEIVCKPRKKNLVQTFRTSAAGCEYTNPDGSERQEALSRVKAGEKIRLLWDSGESGNKKTVYLVRGPRTQRFSISNCFGRLDSKVAEDVVHWLTQESIATTARVVKVVGGTRKRPKLGCILELSAYHVPEKR